MTFHIITLFSEAFTSYLNTSILKRAQEKKIIKVHYVNPRDYTEDVHHKVDDTPYGGGPGMVLKIEPIYKAVNFIKSKILSRRQVGKNQNSKIRVILFSTRGKVFDQKIARRLSKYNHLIFICGRYEGVDERVAEYVADEEISIGDFVLSGGELPAMVVLEAVSRHCKGVLGKQESLEEKKGSYPVYTRPPKFSSKKLSLKVPEVLLSGDHAKIEAWRANYSKEGVYKHKGFRV